MSAEFFLNYTGHHTHNVVHTTGFFEQASPAKNTDQMPNVMQNRFIKISISFRTSKNDYRRTANGKSHLPLVPSSFSSHFEEEEKHP